MALTEVSFRSMTASAEELCLHLRQCNESFSPHLSTRLDIDQYSKKLAEKATTFEAWHGDALVGLVAAYFNDTESWRGFITSVSTVHAFMGRGISRALMQRCIEYGRLRGFREIGLEVHRNSNAAIRLYHSCDFTEVGQMGEYWHMRLNLGAQQPNQALR